MKVLCAKGIEGLELIGIEAEIVTAEQFADIVRADHQRYASFTQRTGFRDIYEKAAGR